MPKENKNPSRRSRRQYSDADNEAASVVRESLKSVIGGNRYSPFPREVPRRDSRATKENMIMPSIEGLHSLSGGIIENGIRYIMFPLHLLRFCIFGTSSSGSVDPKKHTESRNTNSGDKKFKEKDEDEKRSKERKKESAVDETSNGKSPKKVQSTRTAPRIVDENKGASSRNENYKENNKESKSTESTDEMVTAEEDSDSSSEQWSSASSMMVVNMSLDYDYSDRSIPYLEEPMDISIEEYNLDKTNSMISISQHSRPSANRVQNNTVRNISSRSYINEQDSNSSVDEEIARIFQKQCTSSEDELPSSSFPKSFSSCKYEKAKQNNFLYNKMDSNYCSVSSRSRKGSQDDEAERKKKTSTEFVANNKRRKIIIDENRNEKHTEYKSESKTRESKRSSRQGTPTKYKSRSSRTPTKNKESKRKNIKYKETATQTDSAFSDDDVEMIPIDTKLSEKQFCCKYAARKSQFNLRGKEMEQELNYIADNEDSNDGFLRIAHKRISSCSTSSSSTDLGFDERASVVLDMDISTGRHTNSPDNINTLRTRTRAPPGFPEVPQNPPLTSIHVSKQFVLTSSKDDSDPNSSLIKAVAVVPPAPSPMRHLYYDYPEFMDLPVYVNSSKILNNILKNNYYR